MTINASLVTGINYFLRRDEEGRLRHDLPGLAQALSDSLHATVLSPSEIEDVLTRAIDISAAEFDPG